jgi:hypothetical protein
MKYIIDGKQFENKTKLKTRIQEILHSYPIGQELSEDDFAFMRDVLDMHPDSDIKIGCGVVRMFVRQNAVYRRNREFWLQRLDGSETDFSFNECLKPTTPLKKFKIACRNTIREDVIAFRDQNLSQDSVCPFKGQTLTVQNTHVDHVPPATFDAIVHDFIKLHSINPTEVKLTGARDGEIGDNFADSNLSEAFRQFHNEKAQLRLVSAKANLSDIKRGQTERRDT